MRVLLCVLGIILCALGVSAFPRPKNHVPPQCADPTFACQDLENARACGVVKTCIHDIWETMSVPDDNDEICDLCKEMVKEARDQLLSNMTQEEIKEVFEGSCKLLPVKLVADACIKLVDEFIPQLVEMLASRMDPNMVCTVSGLCFVSRLPTNNKFLEFVKIILPALKDNQCQECTTMVTDVQSFLKSSSEDDVKKYIETVCNEKIPSYLCDILIGSYFPSIYDYIVSTDAKTLCSSAGICPKVYDCKGGEKINDELTCEFCYHVLQHVKDLITTNTTVEEFRTALLNFCNHTGSFHDKCTALVNDYYDMLFDYIRKLDAKGLCTLIGLCNNEKCVQTPLVKLIPAEEAKKRIPMIKLEPASHVTSNLGIHPLVKLLPARVASKKEMIESNDIFAPLIPLEKYIHPLPIFERDTECAFCKAISFFLKQDLNGDISKESVRTALNNVCEKWVMDFPDHCKRLVEKYSKKFELLITKGVEFEQMCILAKTCMAEDTKSELKVTVVPKLKDGPFCDLCKDAMNQVETALSDPATKQKIEKLIDQACNVLPQSLRDDCTSFLNSNVDALIDILQQELQPDNICPALGLCDKSSKLQISQRVKGLECDICKDVVTTFRQKLSDPDAKKIVLTFLEEGCARLPGSLSQECKTFIDENIDTVIGMIIQELDPNNVCSILKICPGSINQEKSMVKDVECELCKEVIGKVEDLIKDQKTEEEIKNALDSVCGYLPSSMSAKCKSFVDKYTDLIITLLMQEMDPNMVCAALNICPGSIKERPKKLKDVECDLCKEVVGKVEDLVKDKKTEDEIRDALDKVCSYLPSSWATKCKSFVDQYTETLITLLLQEMDPTMICAALNVCPASAQFPAWQSKAQDLECQGCQYALHFLQEQLSNPDTQAELKNVLKKMCDVLPQTYAKNCDAFVDEYGASLLVLLAQEIDPSKMCYQLQLCTNQTKIFEKVNGLHPFSSDECSVCTTVVDYVDKLLEEDDVDKEITQLVEKVCTVLPTSYVDKCKAILETYGPYILQMIGQLADSKEVCQEIDLCAIPPGHVHLVGGNKCTFGPSYWCKSSAHASACKAESFCKEKVWEN